MAESAFAMAPRSALAALGEMRIKNIDRLPKRLFMYLNAADARTLHEAVQNALSAAAVSGCIALLLVAVLDFPADDEKEIRGVEARSNSYRPK